MIKNVLLAVHAKKSKPVDVKDPTLQYVKNTYGPKAVADVEDDLEEVQRVRDTVIAEANTLYDQRELLAKYYRILTTMESRFPISRTLGHVTVLFPWNDAFKVRNTDSQANIQFEKAAIMFNIGAITSQLALSVDRKVGNGSKDASKFFQDAAGAFAYMRDRPCLKIDTPRPVDMSFECTTMLEKLMLAQAQECVLEKAGAEHKSPALQARLAKQIALYYDECSKLLTVKPLSEHFDRSWQAHATVKSLLYHLEADLQNAFALRTEDDLKGVANEISRLKAAFSILTTAKKEAKNASKELQESVQAKEESINQRLLKSERENATVYLQRVPDAADLPSIVPASVVKSLPPVGIDPDAVTQRMFHGVVPDTSAKSMSKYTDMVDTLIRKQTERLDAASDDARIKLREWELPEALQALEPGSAFSLPDGLRVELEEIAKQGGTTQLNELLAQVKQLRHVAIEELDVAGGELDAEQREDEELRAHYGARWKRSPSDMENAQMRQRLQGYKSNLQVAEDSDARLEIKITGEVNNYSLSPEEAARKMPHLQAPMLSVDNMEPATVVATLRHALDGLSTLSTQRAGLEQALKERRNSDDILPKLLSVAGDNLDSFFKIELTKYDDLVKEVDDNLSKQQQVMQVISQSQASFRQAYNFNAWRKSCMDAAAVVRVQAKEFKEVQKNLSEGVGFYMSLQEAIASLRTQIGDYCMNRKVQRDEMLKELKKAADAQEAAAAAQQQMAALNLQRHQQQQQQLQYQQQPQQYGAPQQQYSQTQGQQYPQPAYQAVVGGYGQPLPQPKMYGNAPAPPGGWMQPPPPGPGGYPPQQQQTPQGYYQQQPYGAPPPPPPNQQQQQQYGQPPPQQQQQNHGWFGFGR